MLRAAGDLAGGHWSDYHRVFSRAAWSLWPLGKVLASAVLRWVEPHGLVRVIADDTTAQHRGKHVYGKGCHHDAVRSSHRHTVWRWGHKWVVLSISVAFPFTSRRWALPVLVALYRPEALNRAEDRRHKTPAHRAGRRQAGLFATNLLYQMDAPACLLAQFRVLGIKQHLQMRQGSVCVVAEITESDCC